MSRGAIGFLPNQHAASRCRLEDSLGRIHGISEYSIFTPNGQTVHRRQHLAGVDPNMQLDSLVAERAITNCDRCAYCALSIILMRLWRSEDCQHSIADHLDDFPAEAHNLLADALDTTRHERLDVFGIHAFSHC